MTPRSTPSPPPAPEPTPSSAAAEAAASASVSPGAGRPPVRRLVARGREEEHRVASPLELFFDLCFVVAVAQAGVQLVHAVAEAHTAEGIVNYAMVFFAIWWAWMNFTWFASAYDNDDVPYRLVTLVQIAGVLVLAAGVARAFEDHDWLLVVLGYVIMRLGMTAQWLRAARTATGAERVMALRYAGGVALCQVGWLGLLVLPEPARPWLFLVMAIAELCVPVYAEKGFQTSWHPHHIAERYGLFTIIVLGETILAATVAVKSAASENDALGELLPIAVGGLLIVFSAWWIYFTVPIHGHLRSNKESFLWGYGHYLIFASAAAIGAGLEVSVEQAVHKAHISTLAASAAVTLPTALYLLSVWALHARHSKVGTAQQTVLPLAALAVIVCTFLGHWAVLAAGIVSAVTVAVGVAFTARDHSTHNAHEAHEAHEPHNTRESHGG
ncbi:low temperature requirement protein A [Streptomyces sp. CA-210063]|uniref:low temperature requirement protein A n=1 Tax=Streptomyces sp. CA-210063 TaxID=2801029 RepID=UPI00214BB3AB|nr:low temperature requirement protein A [Streptomyces sp. CA-210063]UUU33275.1 low temperature requirement protein A [Streptomyces sp. CA-210063]